MHQLLQTSVGERKTVLRGVWCVPGLSSRLFSVRAHLKSAPGNSCVLEFVVSALHTSVFTVPLVDDPSSGLFSFSGTAVVVAVQSALVSPAVVPLACSSKSTSAADRGPARCDPAALRVPHVPKRFSLRTTAHRLVWLRGLALLRLDPAFLSMHVFL